MKVKAALQFFAGKDFRERSVLVTGWGFDEVSDFYTIFFSFAADSHRYFSCCACACDFRFVSAILVLLFRQRMGMILMPRYQMHCRFI